jgi:hypothetical protein
MLALFGTDGDSLNQTDPSFLVIARHVFEHRWPVRPVQSVVVPDDCYESIASLSAVKGYVRSTPISGAKADISARPIWAKSRHGAGFA